MIVSAARTLAWILCVPACIATAAPSLEAWLGEQRLSVASDEGLTGDQKLAQLVDLARSSDKRVDSLLNSAEAAPVDPPSWLLDGSLPDELTASVRLEVARALVASNRFEAALAWIDGVRKQDVSSPATLLYCDCVCRFLLLDLEGAKLAGEQLQSMEDKADARQRYVAATILRQCESLKPDEPQYIAMQMRDVERRLRLGQCEDEDIGHQRRVVDALDSLIKEMEKKRGDKSSSSAAGSASGQGQMSQPMEESRPGDLKGDGQVPTLVVDGATDWGAMPPAERTRVLQQIQQNFPPHYRAVVEEYFKSLSSGEPSAEDAP